MTISVRATAILVTAFCVSSCGVFGSDDDKELEPADLVKIDTKVNIKRLWSAKIGGDAEFLRVALRPVGDGNRIYAASRDGNVVALHPETGKTIWRTQLETELSGGPGVGEGIVVVGAADGFLLALDSESGVERWRVNISGETLARPVIKGGIVVALTIDNVLRAVSAFDGTQRWIVEQSVPRLTMRGSATPVVVGTSVIAGFDNGKLASVDLDSGDTDWEVMLSPPTGRSDLERLSDVDGLISVVGQDVYASGYQGGIAAIASESGQVLWAREVSSFEGVSADWNNLYTVGEDGTLIALSRSNGEETWRQSSLLRREPTLPIPFQTTVVVGDLEGYLHFFSNFDGDPVARVRVGGEAISNEPIVVADRLYVQSDSGSVAAYVVQQPKRKRDAPDIADEGA
ncbi:MAG: outer membrane protein assembly factor BamB [Gammaproteobacteria bacterium]|nr:outer membrane protein assembly factor BamB [Gammaproteobacteria bacterium]MDH3430268.1 outer membrane protein assembly factor BamB [Gammaproteobacteria bacterium]MDH3434559.1 outer membrane protein assembly factor BamB [Gammaproteobacteria bacterium]